MPKAISPTATIAVGARIRESRVAKKLTQTDLGAAVGVDQRTVSGWELGDFTYLSLPMLASIAAATGTPPSKLIEPLDDYVLPTEKVAS